MIWDVEDRSMVFGSVDAGREICGERLAYTVGLALIYSWPAGDASFTFCHLDSAPPSSHLDTAQPLALPALALWCMSEERISW